MKGVSSKFEEAFGELVVDIECSLKGESAMMETKANVTANRTARSVTNELGGWLRVTWQLEDKRPAFFHNHFFTFVTLKRPIRALHVVMFVSILEIASK